MDTRVTTALCGVRRAIAPGIVLACAVAAFAQPVPYKALNSAQDDYAVAFRATEAGTEVWLTTSRGCASPRSRRIMRATCGASGLETPAALVAPVNQDATDPRGVVLDGCPTFSQCDDSTGVIVSNRLVGDRSKDNDLYEIRFSRGAPTVTRLDDLSSDAWDDSPALAPDGETIYFATDRERPGAGRTDIYFARRDHARDGDGGAQHWTTPAPVAIINTMQYSEQSPFVGDDGFLYYATNQTDSGDYDIWRIQLDPATGAAVGTAAPVPFAGVNRSGSDEGHPVVSPGGRWFLFSSNRGAGAAHDFDIYMTALPSRADTIALRVYLRTRELDTVLMEYEDATVPIATMVTAIDRLTGTSAQFSSTQSGDCALIVPALAVDDPAFDRRMREVIVRAAAPSPRYVSSVDTLVFDEQCGAHLAHTLFLWDTAVFYSPVNVQKFQTQNIEFFVTGYWCPTTQEYVGYCPCQSVALDSKMCVVLDVAPPEVPCDDNDLFRYHLNYTPPTIDTVRQPGLCIKPAEAKRSVALYAHKVDSAITRYVTEMSSALRTPTVQRAMRKGKTVRVEVVGWTDPRSISPQCEYTGKTIDLATSFVTIDSLEGKSYWKNGVLKFDTHFPSKKPYFGNDMLSDLRAYETAMMLDTLWRERIPEYRALREKPGALALVAVGRAIKQDNLPNEKRRSVTVSVSVPNDEAIAQGLHAQPGASVLLCGMPCAAQYGNRVFQRGYSDVVPERGRR